MSKSEGRPFRKYGTDRQNRTIASQGDDPAGAVLGFNLVNPPNAFLYSNEREEN